MTDLLDQLSSALGSSYRVERELGGGGMSHVFLAEEIALGRQVVIKVLPPEMAAGVNQERFRREIQLAARLQHPHIVPLLTAGAAGDLLYYVMPYIKGESLRAKLARENELPVAEVVRILREVTDALAYAHAEGVVHRDIKPDNVMISGGHALVTDFGVAKAVSDSSGDHSLTSFGLAIGTPTYMAPEQAAGEPNVDHRADLYALGATAFEMLAGRPPFSGLNAQALLAAHVTQTPQHVNQLRPLVPAALDSVVMRCLEKRAADRWQHAHELLPHLDFMMTPSTGGTAPTMSAYPMSTGAEAALRWSDPFRVLATFLLASFGAFAVVWLAVRLLGLPTWVVYGAIGLIVVGFPIVMITAFHERRRAVARTTNSYVTPPKGVERLLTWRRALTGGAVAFAGLGLLAIVYTAMRLLGVGSVGTLMAKGTLAERDRIVLAEFDDRTSDSTLGTTVSELLRTDLAQSRSISVYDAAQLRDVMARMRIAPHTAVTFDVAKEVATREGLKAVLAGEIAPLGAGYVLSARLVATKTGDVLWAGRETVASADGLPGAIDRLSGTLRERVGESLRSIRGDPPLDQMTTRSTEALRLYAQAQRADDAGDNAGATGLLERAIGLDSTFAMAYRKVGILLKNSGGDTTKVRTAFTRAYDMRDRVSTRERYLAEAAYHAYVDRDTAKAVAAYSALLDQYPDDRVAVNNLALLYRAQQKDADALVLYKRAIRMGTAPAVLYTNALALIDQLEGVDSAGAVIRAFAAAYPGNPNVVWKQAQFLDGTGRYDSARVILERQRDATKGNPGVQANVLNELLEITMLHGRLGESETLFRQLLQTVAQAGQVTINHGIPADSTDVEMVQFRENVELNMVHDTAAALALLNQTLARVPPERRMESRDMAYLDVAQLFASANQLDEAHAYWRKWESSVKDSVRANPPDYALPIRAQIARAEGRYDDALRDLRVAHDKSRNCTDCYAGAIAGVFAQAGKADSALVYYERLEKARHLGVHVSVELYERLGSLYEARGDKANAVRCYQQVAELWKDADPALRPQVTAARAKIAALGGH